ncbi:GxxExxY protein [Chloroflexi bacterium TSY]|nr:GxxExxY protein [Chloroflexi bacterium TSY]
MAQSRKYKHLFSLQKCKPNFEPPPILDALYEVHYLVGPSFLHQVYRRAVRIELGIQGVNHEYIKELPLRFENVELGRKPTRLFWVESKILAGIGALKQLTPRHTEKLRWAMSELGCLLGSLSRSKNQIPRGSTREKMIETTP